MPLLGFTSFYREGFEVVLFLRSNRFKPGDTLILCGVVLARCGRFRDYSDSHIREPSLAVPEDAGRDGSDARSCAAGDSGRRGSGDATCSMVANDENSATGTCNSIVDGTVVLYIPHCRNTERPLAGLIVFGSCIAANHRRREV